MIFAVPWALAALALLPAFYFLLRLNPPAPRRVIFPPVALLLGMPNRSSTPHSLPVWLLLLRLLALTLVILGFADPMLRPPPPLPGEGPLLLVIDDGWASAAIWLQITNEAAGLIAAAGHANRPILLLTTARTASNRTPNISPVLDAAAAQQILNSLQPYPWPVDRTAAANALNGVMPSTRIYLADGLTDGPDFNAFLTALRPDRVIAPGHRPPLLGSAIPTANGGVSVHVISNPNHADVLAETQAGAVLARASVNAQSDAAITLPPQLAKQLGKFVLDGPATAGGITLADTSLRTVTIGLATDNANSQTPFLGPLYFLNRALPANAQLQTASLTALLRTKPDIIILSDETLNPASQAAIISFITDGGILLRFAGPASANAPDSLFPDPLLSGDRQLGGTFTWAQPQTLQQFPGMSPLAGLPADPNVTVSRQMIADPTKLIPTTIWATLKDGTPLIIGTSIGRGSLIAVLTTANTDWSNLVLSALFPALLDRVAAQAPGHAGAVSTSLGLTEQETASGQLVPPVTPASLAPATLPSLLVSPVHPPGLYGTPESSAALNLGNHIGPFEAAPLVNPARFGTTAPQKSLGPNLITTALLLLLADITASLALRGALGRVTLAALLLLWFHIPAHAQDAALKTELGYVKTGDAASDQISADGLRTLSEAANADSSVQLGPPAGLTPGQDDLAFYPLIYWRLPAGMPAPTQAACAALTSYMAHSGLLVIDTAGGSALGPGSGAGFAPDEATTLARATACLNLPPLEPLTTHSILAHSFFVIRDFPGRFTGAPILIAASGARDADDVTSIIIGQNDWAAAWAEDNAGVQESTPIPGGDQQRVIAARFGINLVIYALTGNYKSDQARAAQLLNTLSP